MTFLNVLRSKSMPAIASKQAPAETPNVVIPEATPSSEEAKEMLKAEKPVSETAAPNITEPVVEEVSAWRTCCIPLPNNNRSIKQPIFADTEAGTDHSGPELANKADNTEADKHVEGTKTEEGAKTTEEVPKLSKTKEDKKDIKKSAVKVNSYASSQDIAANEQFHRKRLKKPKPRAKVSLPNSSVTRTNLPRRRRKKLPKFAFFIYPP